MRGLDFWRCSTLYEGSTKSVRLIDCTLLRSSRCRGRVLETVWGRHRGYTSRSGCDCGSGPINWDSRGHCAKNVSSHADHPLTWTVPVVESVSVKVVVEVGAGTVEVLKMVVVVVAMASFTLTFYNDNNEKNTEADIEEIKEQ